ncbi:hypothetical protein GJ496_004572 [Pomphorhynchus laevis]|nr:hypothetical protein GJ496_004572 [Pomphorhynchus laevis]
MEKEEIISLIEEAIVARENAYAKYSNFKVGSVVVDEAGNKYRGVNVENGSFGLTNCAERTAIFSGVTSGMKKIKVICVVGDTSGPVSPCGACRQVIKEFASEKTLIILANLKKEYKVVTIEELLPYGFVL